MKRYLVVLLILVLLVPVASAGELGTPAKTPPPGELDTPGLQAHGETQTPPSTPPGEIGMPGAPAPQGDIDLPGRRDEVEPVWMRLLRQAQAWLIARNR